MVVVEIQAGLVLHDLVLTQLENFEFVIIISLTQFGIDICDCTYL